MSRQEDDLERVVQAAVKRLRDYIAFNLKVARLALTDIVDGTAERGAAPDPDPLKQAQNVIVQMKKTAQVALSGVGGKVDGPES